MRDAENGTPLAATLERLATMKVEDEEVQLSARLGLPDGPGWVTVEGLAKNPALLEDLLARLGREYEMEYRPFTGTTLLRDYLWRSLSTAVAALLTERRLPDLRTSNVALRFDGSGFVEGLAFLEPRFFALPDDPEAAHPDAAVVPSEDALLGELRGTLSETHLPAVVPALRGLRVRRGTRALQRAVSDVCAEALMFVGRDLGREDEGCALAESLLSAPSPLQAPANYYVLEYPGGTERTRIRHTCCLYYKVGDGCCFTCPRKTDEERVRQLTEDEQSEVETA